MNESAEDSSMAATVNSTTESTVTVSTIGRFLVGRADAIQALAGSRGLLILGALLVLSAGFAREYDAEDLMYEPWHVLIPHAASFLTSLLLYCMCRLTAVRSWADFRKCAKGYGTFLGLFWMTAPLAWIYAIPFERMLTEGGATRANLYLLGIVSVWRVALMIRVISVCYNVTKLWTVVFTVLFFGDAVMLFALHFLPAPLLQIMGGIQLTEPEEILMSTKFLLQLAGYPLLLVLGLGYLATLPTTQGFANDALAHLRRMGRSVWILAAASVLVWGFVLPFTQPAQSLARRVNEKLHSGRIAEALTMMSENGRADFPPIWHPAPLVAFPDQNLEVTDVIEVIAEQDSECAVWVKRVYAKKLIRELEAISYWGGPGDEKEVVFRLAILLQLEVGDWYDQDDLIAREIRSRLKSMASQAEENYSKETATAIKSLSEELELQFEPL